jgi:short-subunit dehydrogenase
MRALIIGGSAGLGRAIASRLAQPENSLLLLARDARDLDATARDLELRTGCTVGVLALDIATADPEEVKTQVRNKLGAIDVLLVIAGVVDPDDFGEIEDAHLRRLIDVNFVAPIRLINALIGIIQPGGHLVLAGTIGAIRPRARNGIYGASKLGLEHYVLGRAQAHPEVFATVACYRLGYMRTAMTFGQRLRLPPTTPERAARVIVEGIGSRQGLIYLPSWWRLVAVILRLIPFRLYRRFNF